MKEQDKASNKLCKKVLPRVLEGTKCVIAKHVSYMKEIHLCIGDVIDWAPFHETKLFLLEIPPTKIFWRM